MVVMSAMRYRNGCANGLGSEYSNRGRDRLFSTSVHISSIAASNPG